MSSHFDTMRYDPSRDADFWSEAAPATAGSAVQVAAKPGGGGGRSADPLDKLRRLLRGRAVLAVVLATVGGLLGAALGFVSQKPVYEADGTAFIPPAVPAMSGGEQGNPNYRQFMQTEANYAESEQMALAAMEDPAWKKAIPSPWLPTHFATAANAGYNGADNLMRFDFKSSDPKVALAGVQALMTAYEAHFLEQRNRAGTVRAPIITRQLAGLDARRKENQEAIEAISGPWGTTELTPVRDVTIRNRDDKAAELRDLELNLQQAVNARDAVKANPDSVSEADLAAFNDGMKTLLEQRAAVSARLQEMNAAGIGAKQKAYANAQQQAEAVNANIDGLSKRLRGDFFGFVPVLTPGYGNAVRQPVTTAYIEQLQGRTDLAKAALDGLNAKVAAVMGDITKIAPLLASRQGINEERDRLRTIESNDTQNSGFQESLGTIRLYRPSPEAVFVAKDKRQAMAIGGGILGFGIPLGLVLLLGTLDSRFRYSDDATQTVSRAPLLGILPNLPDRLSDPNQASIAAHCVHQIRTMLQINHGSDEPRAFAVTSAQRGDGKTSLALALGLSYAASGARTLLVDTDLQSGGLSNRLGVGGDEGVMDALSGGELLRYVCETDVTDLAILPIGRGVANHAGAFSPGAVRHLIEQAKRRYDVIVCDTGPVLGSIEATPIVAASDGVILAVSRGQSRPLVNKALSHLETVGATVAGMVFNRAHAGDFEKSVSGMNLRGGSAAGRLAGKGSKAKPASKLAKAG